MGMRNRSCHTVAPTTWSDSNQFVTITSETIKSIDGGLVYLHFNSLGAKFFL